MPTKRLRGVVKLVVGAKLNTAVKLEGLGSRLLTSKLGGSVPMTRLGSVPLLVSTSVYVPRLWVKGWMRFSTTVATPACTCRHMIPSAFISW